ncbi:ATP synthase F1 subunit gamma [Candidatus Uhrbacteria bacterium]|nr:ATP synthase F1 subunit gamma [Candidatus Uhrbacteria bacterium]MBT7717454.1 ATP synthase F1 subunit gamma [Candidatus Uhrbacteria bacterium]
MAASTKTVKRRIKSIANTMKITKAMELVAASKMRRATQAVIGTRPFSQNSWDTINMIGRATENVSHPLLEENADANKTLFILFTADRGLAGGFNANMVKEALSEIKKIDDGTTVEAIAVGRRGGDALSRNNIEVIARFEDLSNKPTFSDILPIGNMIMEAYYKKEYKRVIVGYTDFVSSLTQKPRVFELLPLGKPDDELGKVDKKEEPEKLELANEYIFEPSPSRVLERMLPRLIETMLYQALLESAASEHSARMMAMRNATDSAEDMLKELTFTYNRIRQASITQEIAEISSGKAAIE